MAARTKQRLQEKSAPKIAVPLLCIVLSACVQPAGTNARLTEPSPEAGVAATSDPLVLSGVAYTEGDAPGRADASSPAAANADVVAEPSGGTPEPVVSSTPLPPTDPAPASPTVRAAESSASTTDTAAAASQPAPAATADGYPNINITPQPRQPQGKLLTPEERAKLIEELNALAGRSGTTQ